MFFSDPRPFPIFLFFVGIALIFYGWQLYHQPAAIPQWSEKDIELSVELNLQLQQQKLPQQQRCTDTNCLIQQRANIDVALREELAQSKLEAQRAHQETRIKGKKVIRSGVILSAIMALIVFYLFRKGYFSLRPKD